VFSLAVRGDAESGEYLFMGNTLAALPLEPSFGFLNVPAFLRALRLIVYRRIGNRTRDGIQQSLKESDYYGDLVGTETLD
jgi:hypothetical protein